MKTIFAFWLLSSTFFLERPMTEIGVITERIQYSGTPTTAEVEYTYTKEKKLILVYRNVCLNAADIKIGGTITTEKQTIKILPKEIYDSRGPVDSTDLYTIRYTLPNVIPGQYKVIHDDSETNGENRVITLNLDLRNPGTKKYSFKPARKQIEPDH